MTDAKVKYDGPCLRCRIGQHEVCYRWDDASDTCCDQKNERTGEIYEAAPILTAPADALSVLNGPVASSEESERVENAESTSDEDEADRRGGRVRIGKRDASLKDQQSTGRKRAALLYPLNPEASCEWQGLARAGGGKFPIVGCSPNENRTQTHRHHGPDKNTLNNEEGNVHRICAFCHNRWHAKNDSVYVPGETYNPHDAETKATESDQLLVEFEEVKTQHLRIKD